MTSYSPAAAYNRGCALGTAAAAYEVPQDTVVILDFGSEWYQNGGWGTRWTGLDNLFHPYTDAQAVVREYAHGFWVCTGGDWSAHLTIAVGVRNIFQSSPPPSTAGLAWAQLMTTFTNNLGIYGRQVSVAGAIDAEPAWSSASDATSWATGYSGYNGRPYYDYGSADGCPPYGSCNNGWSQSVEYAMAWGVPAVQVIPEIYWEAGGNAGQWQQISLWGATRGGAYGKIVFSGSLTQWNACHYSQSNLNSCTATRTDNTPLGGWTQLTNALNSDSRTTQATIYWTTDINWG